MEWSDVRIFLAVARHGSLGAAARALKLSHPTIGRRLRALEAAVGQTLFQRHNDGLVLTDAGAAVLPQAEAMEVGALALQRRLAGRDHDPAGVLRISCADWFASSVLAPVLCELGRRHPRLLPEVIAGARPFDLVRREADLAFRIVPFAGADIVQRRLLQLRYGVYAGAGVADPLAGDGADCRLIVMDTAHYDYPDTLWLQDRLPRAQVAARSNSRELQARLCALGLGLAVLPRALGDRIAELRPLDLGASPPSRDVWMGYHRDVRRMDRLRALADLAVAMLGEPDGDAAERN